MNKTIFVGNLTKDFDYSVNNNVKVARGAIALNRGKDKDGNDRGADFINLVAFDKTAEVMDKYGKKGKKMLFECHVRTGSYEKEGKKYYTTDFYIDRFEFLDSARTETTQDASEGFIPIPDMEGLEELPFA